MKLCETCGEELHAACHPLPPDFPLRKASKESPNAKPQIQSSLLSSGLLRKFSRRKNKHVWEILRHLHKLAGRIHWLNLHMILCICTGHAIASASGVAALARSFSLWRSTDIRSECHLAAPVKNELFLALARIVDSLSHWKAYNTRQKTMKDLMSTQHRTQKSYISIYIYITYILT